MKIIAAVPACAQVLAQLDEKRPFSAHWSVQAWQGELAQTAAHIWCAKDRGKLVGFIAVRGAAGQYELLNLAVAESQSRRGIGFSLVQRALQELQQTGAERITLEVSTANLPAQALYQKAGFSVWGIRKHFYADGSDALIMGKDL
ncbi:MAG: ribosomal protein S18-alanine N-acetyltransferase [Elusimicrobiaceae bacterium]|nr:ribosomal protein S18-alanine N-acetyltransferase [Elusimicrobiaceae bacterium]